MTTISSKEFSAKYNSKRECYNFLASEVGVYLPPFDNVTSKYLLVKCRAPRHWLAPYLIICWNLSSVVYYLKELMGGYKKKLSTSLIRTIHIPQYDGLGVKEIRQFLDDKHPEMYEYLPEPSLELPKVPKQWLANMCTTVLKDSFTNWVKQQVKARHAKVMV